LKLKHIKLKPTYLTLADLNNDVPWNGEIFAELMEELFNTVKFGFGNLNMPAWTTKPTHIRFLKRQIRLLLA